MKKNITIIIHFYRIFFLAVIISCCLQTMHGMEEIQIIETAPQEIEPIDFEPFFFFCLTNAIQKLARDEIIQQAPKSFFKKQEKDARDRIVQRLIDDMHFPTQHPDITLQPIDVYNKEHAFLNLSLYPLSEISSHQSLDHIIHTKRGIYGNTWKNMKYKKISGTEQDQNIFIYLFNQLLSDNILDPLVGGLTNPSNPQRVFLRAC